MTNDDDPTDVPIAPTYTLQTASERYEIVGSPVTLTKSSSANSAIETVLSLPESTVNDQVVAALQTIGNAGDDELKRWDAVLAAPETFMQIEFSAPRETVKRLLHNEILERRAKAATTREAWRHWGGIFLAAILAAILAIVGALILVKIFNIQL